MPLLHGPLPTARSPDFERLQAACDRLGPLGCCTYSVPKPTGRVAARMFAPSIGVAEDIANGNSTACPAAHLADQSISDIAVNMGDSPGSRSTITATAQPDASALRDLLGCAADVIRSIRVPQRARSSSAAGTSGDLHQRHGLP